MHKGSFFSASSPALGVPCLFDGSLSDRGDMISRCDLFCISLMISGVRIFLCVCWPCVCLLWKDVYSGPLPIFNWIVFLMLSLYSLNFNSLEDISCTNIFSHLVSCLFHFIDGFMHRTKALYFTVASFVYFGFCCSSLRIQIKKKILLRLMSKSLLSIFSVLWFQVLYLSL